MLDVGTVVKSVAGHDADSFYMIIRTDGQYAYIVDGENRKLDKPKRKNIRHIKKTLIVFDVRLIKTDKMLRELLKDFNRGGNEPCQKKM